MTPEQLRAIVDALPLTQKQIAEEICISHIWLRKALSERREIGPAPAKLLRLLASQHGLDIS